ncbi:MAG: response regulator transcription factor [Acidobacteria bacterium]|nr:response regulator transcription factor [Acidobacteriota bacterium]
MSEFQRVRVVLLAHWPVVRAGLRRLLEHHEDVRVVGEFGAIDEVLAAREHCDVIVVDPDCEEISLRAVSVLAEACESRILVFTSSGDARVCTRAIELGASGVVSKDASASVVVRAVLKVHAGELWLDRAKTAAVLSRAIRRRHDPETLKIASLTKREREIVALVGEGLRNSAIAERLFISEATVRNHLTSILGKLELADRFDLAVYAFRHELIPPPEAVRVAPAAADASARPRPVPVPIARAATQYVARPGGVNG